MNSPKKPDETHKVSNSPEPPVKKPYAPPHLIVYGSIEKLTKTGGKTKKDGKFTKSHF